MPKGEGKDSYSSKVMNIQYNRSLVVAGFTQIIFLLYTTFCSLTQIILFLPVENYK
jgi:hypothetical protein